EHRLTGRAAAATATASLKACARATVQRAGALASAMSSGARTSWGSIGAAARWSLLRRAFTQRSSQALEAPAEPPAASTQDAFDFQRNLKAREDVDQKNMAEDLQLLELQQQIQRHAQFISMLSNILKVENDTAKNTIANMR